MYALIRAVVWVRRNIRRLVLQSSFLKGPYAFCSESESGYERLASPLSLTTSVLTHKVPPPSCCSGLLTTVPASSRRRTRLVVVYADPLGVGGVWDGSASACRACNSALFFYFLALSLSMTWTEPPPFSRWVCTISTFWWHCGWLRQGEGGWGGC